jgi:hypothetical protein
MFNIINNQAIISFVSIPLMYKSDCDYIIIIIQNQYKIPHESRKDVNKTDDYAVKYILCRRGGGEWRGRVWVGIFYATATPPPQSTYYIASLYKTHFSDNLNFILDIQNFI